MRSIFPMLFVLFLGMAHARYLGSYTARLSLNDHYSSRGNPLYRVADILQQDRANFHRFGLRDPEDSSDNYFRSRSHRARMGRMLRRGWVERGLADEIVNGTPLVQVDIYNRYIEVRRVTATASQSSQAIQTENTPNTSPLQSLEDIEKDAMRRVRRIRDIRTFGFNAYEYPKYFPLKHQHITTELCREGNVTKALVVIANNTEERHHAHGSGVKLSLFLYRWNGNEWILDAKRFNATEGWGGVGTWGLPPDAKNFAAVHLTPNNCALAVIWEMATQGWYYRYYGLILHDGDSFYPVFISEVEENNLGTGDRLKTDWNSTIRLLPRKDGISGPFDILIHRQGYKEGHSFDYRVRYRKVNGYTTYQALSSDPRAKENKP